jgi:hypothetical protein
MSPQTSTSSELHELAVEHGPAPALGLKLPIIHLDIDPTVEPLFGALEGAHLGHNPRYHGRPERGNLTPEHRRERLKHRLSGKGLARRRSTSSVCFQSLPIRTVRAR